MVRPLDGARLEPPARDARNAAHARTRCRERGRVPGDAEDGIAATSVAWRFDDGQRIEIGDRDGSRAAACC